MTFFLVLQVLIPFLFLQFFMGFQIFLCDIPNFQYVDKMSSFSGMAHFIRMFEGVLPVINEIIMILRFKPAEPQK